MDAETKMATTFISIFGETTKASLARAPGRVEVLGNHTDYNGGMVLAATIDRYVWALGTASETVHIYSQEYDESVKFDLNRLERRGVNDWSDYARGVFWALRRRKHAIQGVNAVLHGDVPIGSGLSSSAAMEVALTNLVLALSNKKLNPKVSAMIAFEAERLYCGISCGIMDQFTSQLCRPNSFLAINCANFQTKDVPLSEDYTLVVVDSGVSRAAGDILNQRRVECLSALKQLQESGWDINNLSAISSEYLKNVDEVLDDTLIRRVTHVVRENARVHRGITALQRGNLRDFGNLMYASHASSRDLYEVSHESLDRLVELAQTEDGVIGARLTGAGLGGSILALVRNTFVERFIKDMQSEYEKEAGETVRIIRSKIPGGVIVSEIELS